MGLDMYLNKKTFIGANYEHTNVRGKIELTEGKENTPIKINLKRVSEIVEQVAYWRKANAIHKWFVDNVQDGEDDCREYYVSKEDLEKLINACKEDIKYFDTATFVMSEEKEDFFTKEKFSYKIFPDVQEEDINLPTQGGFFFGNTDYTEYFVRDLQDTVEMLEPLLEESGSFYYQSSW